MRHAAAFNEQVDRHRISQAIGNQEVRFFAVCIQAGQSVGSTIEYPHTMTRSSEKQGVQFGETLLIVHQVDKRATNPSRGGIMAGAA
jgi:hypothetical protein